MASDTELTCKIGNRTIGRSAVAGIGIASVTHQIAINSATAATRQAEISKVFGGGIRIIMKKTKKPKVSPSLCLQKNFLKTLFFIIIQTLRFIF